MSESTRTLGTVIISFNLKSFGIALSFKHFSSLHMRVHIGKNSSNTYEWSINGCSSHYRLLNVDSSSTILSFIMDHRLTIDSRECMTSFLFFTLSAFTSPVDAFTVLKSTRVHVPMLNALLIHSRARLSFLLPWTFRVAPTLLSSTTTDHRSGSTSALFPHLCSALSAL